MQWLLSQNKAECRRAVTEHSLVRPSHGLCGSIFEIVVPKTKAEYGPLCSKVEAKLAHK